MERRQRPRSVSRWIRLDCFPRLCLLLGLTTFCDPESGRIHVGTASSATSEPSCRRSCGLWATYAKTGPCSRTSTRRQHHLRGCRVPSAAAPSASRAPRAGRAIGEPGTPTTRAVRRAAAAGRAGASPGPAATGRPARRTLLLPRRRPSNGDPVSSGRRARRTRRHLNTRHTRPGRGAVLRRPGSGPARRTAGRGR